eukprot:CAMPEP_0174759662 /NCGR_PEP_ID=MMETSP1094-20130205/108383_1 /TAXON_ID=156173 /ORGANISM="Chrysochromulina brevifilum, Strain UTEX LB 985" /LENGTH=457 /DNA_ID=CAMNT_0015965599 /DNA_START=208 /DNA_END=1584 /DNA_ORIENTATION=+
MEALSAASDTRSAVLTSRKLHPLQPLAPHSPPPSPPVHPEGVADTADAADALVRVGGDEEQAQGTVGGRISLASLSAVSMIASLRCRARKTSRTRTTRQVLNLRDRLKRTDSRRTLVARNAYTARKALLDIAKIPRPPYRLLNAICFGSFIDFLIVIRCAPGTGLLTKAVVKHGGPEQLRFLLCLAQFDQNGDGNIDDAEWANYERLSDALIADSVAMCGNTALVSSMLLGLTHLITIGRPIPYDLSDASATIFGDWLLWAAYGLNTGAESAAFFTLFIAVITRNNLTNVLPTRELKIDLLRTLLPTPPLLRPTAVVALAAVTNVLPTRELKIDLLRTTNALGFMGVSLISTLWFFLLAGILGTLVASPSIGFLGCGLFCVTLVCCCAFIAPIRYIGVMLLHEETKRFISATPSFVRERSRGARVRGGTALAKTVLQAAAVAAEGGSDKAQGCWMRG